MVPSAWTSPADRRSVGNPLAVEPRASIGHALLSEGPRIDFAERHLAAGMKQRHPRYE